MTTGYIHTFYTLKKKRKTHKMNHRPTLRYKNIKHWAKRRVNLCDLELDNFLLDKTSKV